ncbi:MAG: hypothetical protein KDK34_18680, partial [Leptospiraceae bacterium]|nr:hypothetical protein [Leptospiraceae bacterium]
MKRHGIELLHIMTLSAFALAQPLYDVLGKHPDFFLVRRSHSADILVLLLTLSLLAPLPLLLIHAVAILAGERFRRISYAVMVFVLAAII